MRTDYENMDPEDFLKILRRVINSQNEITLEDELLASYLEEAGDELPIYAGPEGMYTLWRKVDILETGKDMTQAIRFYQKQGYKIVPNFGEFVDDELCTCLVKKL